MAATRVKYRNQGDLGPSFASMEVVTYPSDAAILVIITMREDWEATGFRQLRLDREQVEMLRNQLDDYLVAQGPAPDVTPKWEVLS